jgi:hypothetical protein
MTQAYLCREEAAEYLRYAYKLKCKGTYLRELAWRGGGPLYRRVGRSAIYTLKDLDAWAKSKLGPVIAKASELREQEKAA